MLPGLASQWDQGHVTGICSHLGGRLRMRRATGERGAGGRMLPISFARQKTGIEVRGWSFLPVGLRSWVFLFGLLSLEGYMSWLRGSWYECQGSRGSCRPRWGMLSPSFGPVLS